MWIACIVIWVAASPQKSFPAQMSAGHADAPAGEEVGEHEAPHVAEEPGHAPEAALHQLEVADRLPELLALLRVLERELEGAVGEPERQRRNARPLVGQPPFHVVALLHAAAEEVLARDAYVVEEDGAGRRRVRAHLAKRLRRLEARRAALDEKGLDRAAAVLL